MMQPIEAIRQNLLVALRDHFSGRISPSDLSKIATELYYVLNKPSDFYGNSSLEALGTTLSDAADIAYYYQHQGDGEALGRMYQALNEQLKRYYAQHKKLLKALSSFNT